MVKLQGTSCELKHILQVLVQNFSHLVLDISSPLSSSLPVLTSPHAGESNRVSAIMGLWEVYQIRCICIYK